MRAGFSVPVIAADGSAPSLPASRASPVSAEEKSSSIWQTHALPLHQHRLMQAIVNCRTAALMSARRPRAAPDRPSTLDHR